MSPAEIEAWAREFSKLQVHESEEFRQGLVGSREGTLIDMELEGAGLKTYQVSWISGFTRRSFQPKRNLCTGQQFVVLALVGDQKIAEASVLLNGELVGRLSSQGSLFLDLPFGRHELTLCQGDSSWTVDLDYDSFTDGYQRLPVPEDALSPAGTSGSGEDQGDCGKEPAEDPS